MKELLSAQYILVLEDEEDRQVLRHMDLDPKVMDTALLFVDRRR